MRGWIDPTVRWPWEVVWLEPEGWCVLGPWMGEGDERHRPHVAEFGYGPEPERLAREAVRWRTWLEHDYREAQGALARIARAVGVPVRPAHPTLVASDVERVVRTREILGEGR